MSECGTVGKCLREDTGFEAEGLGQAIVAQRHNVKNLAKTPLEAMNRMQGLVMMAAGGRVSRNASKAKMRACKRRHDAVIY